MDELEVVEDFLERVAALGRKVINTIQTPPLFRIHPAVGVGRLGNASPDDFFIGPEQPGLPANPPGGNFKVGGKIRKQAARFRIFEYELDEKTGKLLPKEVNLTSPHIASIEWTVHLANRKASYYEFDGRTGFPAPPNPGRTLRNAKITDVVERAKKLEIDPGPKTIPPPGSGGALNPAGTIHIVEKGESLSLIAQKHGIADWHTIYNHPKNAAFKKKHPDPNLIFPGDELFIPTGASAATFDNPKKGIPIPTLGELRLDSKGRLLVLGGSGISKSNNPGKPAELGSYSNNDTWFDDVSDGPVTATVTLKASGRSFPAVGAWVVIGPPDFAPPVGNVITMYERLYDVATQSSAATFAVPANEGIFDRPPLTRYRDRKAQGAAAYKPSYTEEIYPVLQRALDAKWVHGPANGAHSTIDFNAVSKADASAASDRQFLFGFLREPDSSAGGSMPKLLGDEGEDDTNALARLSLTKTQFEMMKNWSDGKFVADWPGSPPAAPALKEEDIPPEDLDRAALENCCGGAFYPGIEAGWLIRNPDIYQAPFRIKHGKDLGVDTTSGVSYSVKAGFFTQQMALPWQADFYACKKEDHPDGTWGWWPGQRPDDVFTKASPKKMVSWTRGLDNDADPIEKNYLAMVNLWSTRGFVVKLGPNQYEEREGPP